MFPLCRQLPTPHPHEDSPAHSLLPGPAGPALAPWTAPARPGLPSTLRPGPLREPADIFANPIGNDLDVMLSHRDMSNSGEFTTYFELAFSGTHYILF
jgi:hypothetical protein